MKTPGSHPKERIQYVKYFLMLSQNHFSWNQPAVVFVFKTVPWSEISRWVITIRANYRISVARNSNRCDWRTTNKDSLNTHQCTLRPRKEVNWAAVDGSLEHFPLSASWRLSLRPLSSKATSPRFFSLAKVTTISFRVREGSSGSNVDFGRGEVTCQLEGDVERHLWYCLMWYHDRMIVFACYVVEVNSWFT